jgi:uncharacterized protein (DUF1330 family)
MVFTRHKTILEFPNMEAAKAWYDGAEYRRVREHRFKGTKYRVTLLAGVQGDCARS